MLPGKFQHSASSGRSGFQSLERVCQIIDWTGKRSKMKDAVYFALDFKRLAHVLLNEAKSGFTFEVSNIFPPPGDQIVESDNLMPLFDQAVAKM